MSKRGTKSEITKGIADAGWGMPGGSQNVTLEGLKAISNSLTPAEAYSLSIDVRSAIQAIAENVAKAKLRLFYRKSGDEIVDGDLYQMLRHPAKGWSTSQFIKELVSNYLLCGELVASLLPIDTGGVAGMVPLFPLRLYSIDPVNPKDKNDVTTWRYNWPNGVLDTIDANSIIFEKNYSPLSHVRGIPPVLAGVNEISASYQAVRYNKTFFENNAMPNHLLLLPSQISKKDREALKDEYVAMHNGYNGNAHKVWVIEGGKDVEIKTLEQQVTDGQFLQLQKLSTSKIAQLYKVPPIEMGMWDQTRFDSVDAEREVFAEGTLMPLMNFITETLQTQLVDRHYYGSKAMRSQTAPVIKHYMREVFERAREERNESDIIILLDPDSLPIVAKLKQNKVDYAEKWMKVFRQTPESAAKYLGIEIEETEATKLVWHQSTDVVFDPAIPASEQLGQVRTTDTNPQPEPEPLNEQQAEKAIEYKNFYRELRKLALDKADAGRLFTLSEADTLNNSNDSTLQKQIRKEHNILYCLFKNTKDTEARKELVKQAFNEKNRQFFRSLVI